jgi:hypothetical protein
LANGVGELFLERAAVGEPGQLVVTCEIVDARFVLTLRSDVLADSAVADELPCASNIGLPLMLAMRIRRGNESDKRSR